MSFRTAAYPPVFVEMDELRRQSYFFIPGAFSSTPNLRFLFQLSFPLPGFPIWNLRLVYPHPLTSLACRRCALGVLETPTFILHAFQCPEPIQLFSILSFFLSNTGSVKRIAKENAAKRISVFTSPSHGIASLGYSYHDRFSHFDI